MTDLDEMWALLEAHQSFADAGGYGKAWKIMCEQRTPDAAWDAAWAAYAAEAAADAAYAVEAAAAAADAAAVEYIKRYE